MNVIQRIRVIIFVSILFLISLVRLSPEDYGLTRRTWIWLILFGIGIASIYILNYKRVHIKYASFLLLTILFVITSMIVGTHAPHWVACVFALVVIGCTHAGSIVITKNNFTTVALTILCAISLYAQWGILQFIVQHDLHMQFIGESVLTINTPGVASFYIDAQKFIRSYGPFAHANSLSGVLVVGCILLLSIYKKIPAFFIYAVSATLLLGLLATFSRATLASAVCIGIYLCITNKNKLVLLALIPLIAFTPLLLGRSTDSHDVAAHDRIEGLRWGIQMETASSLLRGYGIGNYQEALTHYLTRNSIQHFPWDVAPLHSTPLYLLTEFGIIFFSIIVIAVFYVMKKNNLWILLFLAPPILVDHYFATQLGPLLWLTSCAIIVSDVYLEA